MKFFNNHEELGESGLIKNFPKSVEIDFA